MKKVYSKPDIVFESFTLSTNIAAGCEEKANFGDGECGVRWGHSVVFSQSIPVCTSKIEDEPAKYDGLCYHNPEGNYNVFIS